MRGIFRSLISFLVLVYVFLLGSSSIHASTADISAYIAHPDKEAVVLVSNNYFEGEIRKSQDDTNSNLACLSAVALFNLNPNNLWIKNTTLLRGCFIHNLSTDNRNVHNIRAP